MKKIIEKQELPEKRQNNFPKKILFFTNSYYFSDFKKIIFFKKSPKKKISGKILTGSFWNQNYIFLNKNLKNI